MITIVKGELADTDAVAVLRPVSAEWDPVTPATRRLEIAAGISVVEECQKLAELPVGSAVITHAGDLRAEYMVHVIVRSVVEPVSIGIVRRALQNGLRRLSQWGIDSVAMAPLGTGAGNLDPEDSAKEMIPLLLEHMTTSQPPTRVDIVVDSDYEYDVFERELRKYDLPIL